VVARQVQQHRERRAPLRVAVQMPHPTAFTVIPRQRLHHR